VRKHEVTFSEVPMDLSTDLDIVASVMLPLQGSIEVQRDKAGKEHKWHSHTTDETLVIIDGSVRFYHEGGERVCEKGDVINLPCGVKHGSIALEDGAIYLIAMEKVDVSTSLPG